VIASVATEIKSPIDRLLFSPRENILVATDGRSRIRRWRFPSGEELQSLELPDAEILSLAFSPDGRALAIAGIDGRILVTNLDNGDRLADFVAPHTPMFLQYSSDAALRWSKLSLDHLTQMGATKLVAKIAEIKRTGENAIAGFGLPEGMTMELYAGESLVANPASICMDDQGRIFVAETFRYDTEVSLGYAGREIWLLDDLASQSPADRLAMYEKHQDVTAGGMQAHTRYSERIRRLTDTDGDGQADQVTTYADGFDGPLTGTGTGLLARERDLYYTCIPDLWKLSDHDDDGVADERQVIVTGFGVKASLPHGLHGLTWGPDGKLYFSVGDRGYQIETADGVTLHNSSTGAILRCNPDGSELEEVARGFRNPQELAFDRFGNLFTCDNNSNQGDQARLMYVMPGGDGGWQMAYETMPADYPLGPWNLDKLWETPDKGPAAWVLPPIAHVGIGPAGLAFYPGQGLPQRYQDHFFLCDFADAPEVSGVRSFAVRPEGAGFAIEDEHTFISNMLPTDIEFGFDQKVYVSDWIRGAESDGLGRIYAGRFADQVKAEQVAETKAWFAGGFDKLPESTLLDLLRHADMRVRRRAQFALAERGVDVISGLLSVATQGDQQTARLHAIWGLGIICRTDRDQSAEALSALQAFLDDEDGEVRAQAAKELGEAGDEAATTRLVERLGDSSPRVRSMAAQALGRIGAREATVPLLEMLKANADADVFLRHAGVDALARIGDADALVESLRDEDRSVRLAVLLTMRRLQDERIATFLDDTDPDLVVEAARAIHDLPIEAALGQLAAILDRGSSNESLLRRVINVNFLLGQPDQAKALTRFVDSDEAPIKMKREALKALGEWIDPPPRDAVLGVIRPRDRDPGNSVKEVIGPWISQTLQSAEAPLQQEIMLAASKLHLPVGDVSWLGDSNRELEVKTLLLDQMADRNDERLPEAIDVALQSEIPTLRIHAARLAAEKNPDGAVEALASILTEGNLAEQQAAFAALGTIQSPQVDTLLIDWLGRFREGKVPSALKYEILSVANERSSGMVQQELAAVIGFLSQQPTLAQRYQAVLEGGSAERGRLLFEHHTGIQCIRCHQVDGVGGRVGPELSKIGGKVSREYLLESLLIPEQKIAEGYEGVLIATSDGRVISGTLKSENETELRVIDPEGKELAIAKDDIEQMQGGKSVMPGNLLEQITSSDLRDLIEYLASLK
jgi:quinoprotein glucose dehydrogenase